MDDSRRKFSVIQLWERKTVHNPEPCLIGVHADDGQMTTLETIAQLGKVFELKIALGTTTGGNLLLIDAQGMAQVMEQAGERY